MVYITQTDDLSTVSIVGLMYITTARGIETSVIKKPVQAKKSLKPSKHETAAVMTSVTLEGKLSQGSGPRGVDKVDICPTRTKWSLGRPRNQTLLAEM